MAYDAESGVIVLFGGQLRDYSMMSKVSATWVYDCATSVWKKMDSSEEPPAAAGHAMAYDAKANSIVIYGGLSGPPQKGGEPPFTKNLWTIRL